MQWRTVRWPLVAALLVAGLGLRLLLYHFRPPISGDALVYGDIATNMLRHKMYAITVDGVVKPTLIRLPGYPLLLALCFMLFGDGNFLAAVVLQVILDLCACCLLGVLAWRLMGPRAGMWALGLSALCPFTANYSIVPLTESVNAFCIVLALFAFERWYTEQRVGRWMSLWLIPLSFAVTFAALLRPDRILLCAVALSAASWVCLRRRGAPVVRRLSPAMAIAAVFCVPLLLWTARNWRTFHVLQPLAPKYANDPGDEVATGFMRWYRTWGITYKNTVEVYWPYDGSLLNFSDIPSRAFDSEQQQNRTQRLVAKYNEESGSTPDVDAAFAALATERMSAHPVSYYLGLPLARLADMWLQPRTELLKMPLDWWSWERHPGKSAFSFFYVLLNAAYLVLAVVGIRKRKRAAYSDEPALAWAMFSFLLLRSLLLATLDNAEQRYTIDCLPMVLLLASFAFAKPRPSAECDSPSC